MATKRGPKVEPKEINKYKVVVNDLPEKPKALVFEDPIVNETITPELKAEIEKEGAEEFAKLVNDQIISDLREMKKEDLVAEDEFITSEAAKTVHFEFKEEYKLTHNGKDAVIDALPQPKRKKTPGELNQSELRLYHKTGFLPEI